MSLMFVSEPATYGWERIAYFCLALIRKDGGLGGLVLRESHCLLDIVLSLGIDVIDKHAKIVSIVVRRVHDAQDQG